MRGRPRRPRGADPQLRVGGHRAGAGGTPGGIQAFVRGRLAPHKVPREVRVVGTLPRTGSGKIDRAALRAASITDERAQSGRTLGTAR